MSKSSLTQLLGMFVVLTILIIPGYSYSEILFEDNFDNQPDWSPAQPTASFECDSDSCTTAPIGWSAYRIGGLGTCSEAGKNTLNINGLHPRGGSGKSFLFWNEPCASPSGGWGSDGILVKVLPHGYSELYLRFYIKFQPGWKWMTGGSGSPQQKFARIMHNWGGNNFLNFEGGQNHPIWFGDLVKWNNGNADLAYRTSYRYENTYYPSKATPPHSGNDNIYFGTGNYGGTGTDFGDPGMLGDGDWHCLEFYVKMNSAPGVPDGVHKAWLDGNLIFETTDLAWADNGATGALWNQVMIGGNNYNYYDGGEQWYAIDDVVISTTYVGPDYVVGSQPDSLPPASPRHTKVSQTQ